MTQLEIFFLFSFVTQLAHSLEELSTGFHKKWYLVRLPFGLFFVFELAFSSFWLLVLLAHPFPYREELQKFFLVLMFANGVQHIVWWGSIKKYVPGLVTAWIHILVFLAFYFSFYG